jgi:hypothetical protein
MPAELLEKKADALTAAGIAQFPEPRGFCWPAPRLALPAGDQPLDAREVDPGDGVNERLGRHEADRRWH